jgi:hypothetical protein
VLLDRDLNLQGVVIDVEEIDLAHA